MFPKILLKRYSVDSPNGLYPEPTSLCKGAYTPNATNPAAHFNVILLKRRARESKDHQRLQYLLQDEKAGDGKLTSDQEEVVHVTRSDVCCGYNLAVIIKWWIEELV